MLFYDRQIERMPKSAKSIEVPLCCKLISAKRAKLLNAQEFCIEKMGAFVPYVTILIARKLRKVLILLINLDIQNTFFSAATGIFSSNGAWIKNFTLVEEDLIKKPFVLIHISSSWLSKISENKLLI